MNGKKIAIGVLIAAAVTPVAIITYNRVFRFDAALISSSIANELEQAGIKTSDPLYSDLSGIWKKKVNQMRLNINDVSMIYTVAKMEKSQPELVLIHTAKNRLINDGLLTAAEI